MRRALIVTSGVDPKQNINKMSSKENNEVAVEKLDNEKSADGKTELKGTKRAAEVSLRKILNIYFSFVLLIIRYLIINCVCNYMRLKST